jgi:putative toxin-antitoxin system antitoxin component (TIGR02293 family)
MANQNKMVKRARHKASVAGRFVRSERRIRRREEESGTVTIGTVRKGLSTDVFKTVAAKLKMSDRQLAGVLKIPDRTLDRRLKHGVLSPEESDRLARVAKILQRAHEVFGNAEKARGWMNTRLAAFEGETPLQRADTSLGASQVEDVLGRIDYGVYT